MSFWSSFFKSKAQTTWEVIGDFSEESSQLLQQLGALGERLIDKNTLQDFEHSIITRLSMTDYWANALLLPEREFLHHLPGNSNSHAENKAVFNSLASYLLAKLETSSSSQDFVSQVTSEKGDDFFSLAARFLPLVIAKHSFSAIDYQRFLVFEYGCWLLKNLSFQRACGFRAENSLQERWNSEDVMELSSLVEMKAIPLIYNLKRTKSWDEMEIKFRLKDD